MTNTTITYSAPAVTVTPPAIPIDDIKPGFLTSEFWSMTLVHGIAAVTTLLTLLNVHWSKGLSGAQAAVPLVALAISALLQAAYHNKRAAVKISHTAEKASAFAAVVEADYRRYAPAVTGTASTYGAALATVNPLLGGVAADVGTAAADVEKVVGAWHGDMRDVPGPTVDPVAEPAAAPDVVADAPAAAEAPVEVAPAVPAEADVTPPDATLTP